MNRKCLQRSVVSLAMVAGLFAGSTAHAQEDLYKSKCAACHGADGSANTAVGKSMKIRDFHSPDVQKQTDAQLTEIITSGKGAMPSYKGKLTDDQVKQMVAHIRDLAKK